MIEQLLQQFMGSAQGNAALQMLQQQHGLDANTARSSLQAASEGTAQALQQSPGGSNPLESITGALGGGAMGNVVAGALSGVLGGGGVGGAVQGGLSGLVAGRVADMIASRTGLNPQMASAVAASLAPHILNYVREHGGALGGGPAQPQQAPVGNVMQPLGGPQYAPQAPKDPNASGKGAPAPAQAPDEAPWKRVL